MAIAHDATTSVSGASGSSTNITVAAGATFLLVHGIGSATNNLTAVSATAGGNAMTQIGSIVSGENKHFALGLMSPPTGTVAIVITLTGDTDHLSRATTYTGSKTTGQPAQNAQGSGTMNLTTASLTLAADSWMIVGFRSGSATPTSADSTIRTPSTNAIFTADGGPFTGAKTFTYDNGNSGNYMYTQIELEVAPAATSGKNFPTLTLLGVG